MQPWIKKLIRRFITGPKPGDVYIEREFNYRDGNPFEKPLPLCKVEVIAVKKGWVQYRHMGPTWHVSESKIKVFNSCLVYTGEINEQTS